MKTTLYLTALTRNNKSTLIKLDRFPKIIELINFKDLYNHILKERQKDNYELFKVEVPEKDFIDLIKEISKIQKVYNRTSITVSNGIMPIILLKKKENEITD